MPRRHVAATNRLVRTGGFLWKSFSLQQNFVAATSRTNSVWFDFCDLLQRQNSVRETKIFTKILQYTPSDLSLQRVAATCCCNLSPNVYRPLKMAATVYERDNCDSATCCCNLSPVVCSRSQSRPKKNRPTSSKWPPKIALALRSL